MSKPVQFAAIGECMIELAPQSAGSEVYNLNFAGDTYNTSVYLRRLTTSDQAQVNYFTAVGQEPYSEKMLAAMQAEDIQTQHIQRHADRQAGLYLIDYAEDGEREFTYYRQHSAARHLLLGEPGLQTLNALEQMDILYFTGISLAIWQLAPSWDRFESLLTKAKAQGKQIIFDSNIRLRLWQDKAQAKTCLQRFLPYCSCVLSTWEDEQLLFEDTSAEETLSRLQTYDIPQIVLKRGAQDCLAVEKGETTTIPCPPVNNVVDTTGAGDAFNAGIIAGLIQKQTLPQACEMAHIIAGKVIQHPGAVIHLNQNSTLIETDVHI